MTAWQGESSDVFNHDELPNEPRKRWFVRSESTSDGSQGTVIGNKGFASKESASQWIDNLGWRLDWRAGFLFHIKGSRCNLRIVDRHGREPKT